MKLAPLILVLFLLGCASQSQPKDKTVTAFSRQSSVEVAPYYGFVRVPQDLNFSWSPPPEPDASLVAAYNFYISVDGDFNCPTSCPVVIPIGNTTNLLVTGLVGGSQYYFAVTDLTATGEESGPSNIVPVFTKLSLDLSFAFNESVTNVTVQSSPDLNQWSNLDATATNGVYRIDPNPEIPVEFYRAVGQSVQAL